MRRFGLLALLLGITSLIPRATADDFLPFAAPPGFTVTSAPYCNGLRATADLPVSQHHKNVGGSDRAGLCVYTSFWHSTLWQSVSELYEFRHWMESKPGGSFPEKFEATLNAFCKSKGIPIPGYLQHTGGDEEFLDLAIKTGRMPGVTYCGVDGRYPGVIAHMVSLVYLDKTTAAILDNNYPGTWLWMPRADFLARWRGVQATGKAFVSGGRPVGGGWAVVLLASQPTCYPTQPPIEYTTAEKSGCPCGPGCQCKPGTCPGCCPVAETIQFRRFAQPSCPSCPGGRCPIPLPVPDTIPQIMPSPAATGEWCESVLRPGEYGYWTGERCTAWLNAEGKVVAIDAANRITNREIPAPGPLPVQQAPAPAERRKKKKIEAANEPEFPQGGVDSSRLTTERRYWLADENVTREDAEKILGGSLADDSARWNLAAVGEPVLWRKVTDDLAKLDPALRAKINFKVYAPGDWQAAQFVLADGVTLRKPAVNRVGGTIGNVGSVSYTPAALDDLFARPGGPLHVSIPTPAPVPSPTPAPAPAPQPAPEPIPPLSPEPHDRDDADDTGLVVMGCLGVTGFAIYRRKK